LRPPKILTTSFAAGLCEPSMAGHATRSGAVVSDRTDDISWKWHVPVPADAGSAFDLFAPGRARRGRAIARDWTLPSLRGLGMTRSNSFDGRPRKLLAGRATKVRIALASGLLLTAGGWLAPPGDQTTVSVPEERAAPLLEEQVQVRDTSQAFVGVQNVARTVTEHTVAIPVPMQTVPGGRTDFFEPPRAAPDMGGFGVFVSDTHILSHSVALDGRSSVPLSAGAGPAFEATVVAYEQSTGLVLLQTRPSGRPAVALSSEAVAAGALAVGVGRSGRRDIAVPVFVTSAGGGRYTIGTVDESIRPGMPVFTLSGELFAIAAPDGQEWSAVPAREAVDRLIARSSTGERRSSFGLGFQSPTDVLTNIFGASGVVITEVVEEGPADRSDIQPGDVLLAIGDAEVDSIETAARVLGSRAVGAATQLRLRRDGRLRDIEVVPASAYEVAALARANADDVSAPEARVLFSTPVLHRAGIPPTARVVSIRGRPVTTRREAQRQLRLARDAVPVLLRYGGSRYFVALEPGQ
jgi:S1-C subfamily serine protease